VTATAFSSTQIDVAWSDVAGETSYRVERSVPGGTWSTVTSVAANATSYADTGLGPATTYSYRVVALNAAGGSPASPSGTATTLGDSIPPTAPTGLKAVSPKGKINLSWVASTDSGGSGLARYRIWRRSGASAAPVEIGTTATTAYSDGSVRPSVDYFYQVTAVDGAGNESQPSNVVSARSK
jgi:fibronectin type 3 domain-containing protein